MPSPETTGRSEETDSGLASASVRRPASPPTLRAAAIPTETATSAILAPTTSAGLDRERWMPAPEWLPAGGEATLDAVGVVRERSTYKFLLSLLLPIASLTPLVQLGSYDRVVGL
jgi:hypothetical protein